MTPKQQKATTRRCSEQQNTEAKCLGRSHLAAGQDAAAMLRTRIDALHEIEIVVQNIRAKVREDRSQQHKAERTALEMSTFEPCIASRRKRCPEHHRHNAGRE